MGALRPIDIPVVHLARQPLPVLLPPGAGPRVRTGPQPVPAVPAVGREPALVLDGADGAPRPVPAVLVAAGQGDGRADLVDVLRRDPRGQLAEQDAPDQLARLLPVGLPGPDHGRVVEPSRGVVGAVAVGRVVLHVEVVPAAAAVLVLHPEAAVEHAGVAVGAGWALLEVDAEVDACLVAHFEGRENWSGEIREKEN